MRENQRQTFVDTVKIHVKAGDGGDGAVAFLREKFRPFGGPAGGDGGRGGSIVLEADTELMTLLDFKYRASFIARDGDGGGNKNMSGAGADDICLKVPVGTTVVNSQTGEDIGELLKHGDKLTIARGGDGGLGNQHFATSTNKAPRKATPGHPGEEKHLLLELKLIADAGLVGLPNAGKSTLLAAITAATPKIAPYPFTTLSPNLGVFLASDFQNRITLADIPGLIEGAHAGQGLGDRFLRHIERTKILVHLVAPDGGETADGSLTEANADAEALLYAYDLVESELAQYSAALLEKPRIVCLTKIDLISEEDVAKAVEAFAKRGIDLHPISAAQQLHLDALQKIIEHHVFGGQTAPEANQP